MVLLFHVTTHIEGRPHEDILSKKGGGGFPYVAILDGDGDVLAPHGYEAGFSPDTFRAALATARGNGELKAKGAAGDAAAKKAFFLLQLGFKTVSREDAAKALTTMDLSAEEKQKIEAFLVSSEVSEILSGVKRNDPAVIQEVGKRFAEMLAAGRVPGELQLVGSFFFCIAEYAKAQKDVPLYEKALEALKAKVGSEPRAKRMIDNLTQGLEKLKQELAGGTPAPGGAEGGK